MKLFKNRLALGHLAICYSRMEQIVRKFKKSHNWIKLNCIILVQTSDGSHNSTTPHLPILRENCYLGITLALLWHYFDNTLTFLWHYFGFTLTFVWHYFGNTLAILWHYFVITLTLLWHYFGITLTLLWH